MGGVGWKRNTRGREREEWSGVAGIVEQRERGTYSGVYLPATNASIKTRIHLDPVHDLV